MIKDSQFLQAFLLTFRAFMKQETLLDLMIQRYLSIFFLLLNLNTFFSFSFSFTFSVLIFLLLPYISRSKYIRSFKFFSNSANSTSVLFLSFFIFFQNKIKKKKKKMKNKKSLQYSQIMGR